MSTIKSSAEDLTINADGSNEIKFQINAVEKASINSSGLLTSTTIDATKLTGNLPAISGASLTGLTSAQMPTGSVIQVVHVNYATGVNQGGTTYADTGLTATITPSSTSNKILVIVSQAVFFSVDTTNSRTATFNLMRGVDELEDKEYSADFHQAVYDLPFNHSVNHLDSPNTTSATTYKTQFKLNGTTSDVKVQDGSCTSNITLMEIKG